MTIGIDFDNTMVDTFSLFKKILNDAGYKIDNFYEVNKEMENYVIKNFSYDMCYNIKFKSNIKKAFKYFKNNNIKLVLVTARGVKNPEIIPWTKDILCKKGFIFDDFVFCANNKGNVCKEKNIDLMIDDSEKVLKTVKKKHIKTLKFGSKSIYYDYVLNWNDVISYIERISD